ncbi:MAG: bifunctional 4-hydroxy-2-oxoglutarate aldolase/2-dehydro-3-deoxy-phosphogluconate aldolase [Sedimentisphaerales bacterium]|nr:bifunctional 4-hydroxy-2-oxoglutarate aldolase/2-dehydro-3-deoxy-phosphogluconate aldolase [Sedimentisphaerales bacterium]
MDIKTTVQVLLRDGFILVFNEDRLDIVKTAESLLEAGIGNMEVTCRINKPLEKLSRLGRELPEFIAGAASLIDYPEMLNIANRNRTDDPLPSVDNVVDAGAHYLVSAVNFSKATYEKYAGKLPIIPGCSSATEIVTQFSMGANFCKVFPAKELGGPAFIKAVDPAIHKLISLVPTGGTNAQNIPDYIEAGVLVLGGSFSAIDKPQLQKIVEQQDYKLLACELKKTRELIDQKRKQKWPKLDFAKASIEEISRVTGRNFNIR